MIRLVALALTVAVLAAWIAFLRPTFLAGSTGYVMVSGISMQPTYYTGDLVLTRRQVDYRQGDILAYRVPQGQDGAGSMVIHRIVGGNAADGFDLRGDNNDFVDPWHPKAGDIVGKQWVHVPGGARWFAWLRMPLNSAAVVGGISVFSVLSGSEVKKRRKRGKHMRQDGQSGNGNGAPQQLPAPLWAWLGLGAAALAVLVVGAVAVKAFTTSPSRSQYVERAKYEQTGSYDYTVVGPPSSLYPDGRIGPIAAPPRVNGQRRPRSKPRRSSPSCRRASTWASTTAWPAPP